MAKTPVPILIEEYLDKKAMVKGALDRMDQLANLIADQASPNDTFIVLNYGTVIMEDNFAKGNGCWKSFHTERFTFHVVKKK